MHVRFCYLRVSFREVNQSDTSAKVSRAEIRHTRGKKGAMTSGDIIIIFADGGAICSIRSSDAARGKINHITFNMCNVKITIFGAGTQITDKHLFSASLSPTTRWDGQTRRASVSHFGSSRNSDFTVSNSGRVKP